MRELFNISELVQMAVDEEKAGAVFYSTAAERTNNAGLKDIFIRLSKEEKFHQSRFEAMLEALGQYKAPEEYPGQYAAYLRVLTGGRAMPDEARAKELAEQCRDDDAAVQLADQMERDTLMLYNELAGLLPEKHSKIVESIRSEEQGHLVTLAEAKQTLAG